MKVKGKSKLITTAKEGKNVKHDAVWRLKVTMVCTVMALVAGAGIKATQNQTKSQVFAAADAKEEEKASEGRSIYGNLPTGIAGVVSGVRETPTAGTKVKRIGTSCEQVMVGQRIQTVKAPSELNVSASMKNRINDFDSKAASMSQSPKMMSDGDYDTLLHIVEAEAGGEDVKGRILVANVIMNRVKDPEFPDTVTDVVWQYTDGVPQFSPTYDGRIHEVTVSDGTRDAVNQALKGVDYSEGALFFVEKAIAEKQNVSWFEKDLKFLFKYGVHDFYKYPDSEEKEEKNDSQGGKGAPESDDDNLIQMVKYE